MVSEGLPVPPGFVVTTRVFNELAAERVSKLAGALTYVQGSGMDALQKASDSLTQSIREIRLPRQVVSAIGSAYDTLGRGTVSVRSSATAEDLASASFAGQYATVLNVISVEAIIRSLLEVWASLYSPHAIAYCAKNNIPHTDVRMAVVIQRLLYPEASGVLFTQDPVTGEDHFTVNASWGLGEGVVSGVVSTDHFVISPESGQLISSELANKDIKFVTSEHGGVTQVAVPESLRLEPSLSEAQISTLTGLAERVVDLFEGPQDIEFATVGDDVYLLQARPITTALADPVSEIDWGAGMDTQYGWVLHQVLSSRGPLYELQRDLARYYLEGQRVCFEETGSPRNANHIAHITNGYVYVRPPAVDPEVSAKKRARHSTLWDTCAEQGTSYYEVHLRPLIEDRLAQLALQKASSSTLPTLVEYLEACMDAWGYIMGHLHWCMMKAERPPDWPSMFHEITGEPAVDSDVFIQAVSNTTTRLTARLQKLAKMVQSDAELTVIFHARDFAQMDDPEISDHAGVLSFKKEFSKLLRIFGQRTGWSFGSNTTLLSPTWNRRPEIPMDLVASYAERDVDELTRLEAQSRRNRKNATKRMRRRLAGDPDRLERFDLALSIATNTVRSMENHNHMMEQCTTGTLREAMHAVGTALVAKGLIDAADDVLHVSLQELKAVASGEGDTDLHAKAKSRASEWDERARLQPPPNVGSGPKPDNPFAGMSDLPPGVGLTGGILKGVSASRGRATGPARVALQTDALPRVHPGDILVAVNAGAEWTPAMSLLGGIVLDRGAVHQHAALVAREYRIPAVLMTRDATSVIKEGMTITVDGDAGTVELGS